MKKKTIITIRHTESEHHVKNFSGGVSNWNLTDLGIEQASFIGKWLSKNENLAGYKMITSDLPRTVQTAKNICKSINLIPEYTKELREIDLGEGNGIPYEEYDKIVSPKPAVYDPNHRSFPHAENDTELWARMIKFYDSLIKSDVDNFILVSHGGSLLFLHLIMMGKSLNDIKNDYYFGKAGAISKFIIDENRNCSVEYLNKNVL